MLPEQALCNYNITFSCIFEIKGTVSADEVSVALIYIYKCTADWIIIGSPNIELVGTTFVELSRSLLYKDSSCERTDNI